MTLKIKSGLRGVGHPAVGSLSGGSGDVEFGTAYSGSAFSIMTEDLHCDNLIVRDQFSLITAGYKIYCRGSIYIFDSGVISNNGNNGAGGGTGGAALQTHSVGGSYAGGAGSITNASAGSGVATFSGAEAPGGDGAAGSGGTAGTGGPSAFDATEYGQLLQTSVADEAVVVEKTSYADKLTGGGGGGGGGGDGAVSGAGGGSGGGVIYIEAQDIIMDSNGQINALGGNGGSAGAGRGGGGGGGGGLIILKVNDIYLRGGSAFTKISVAGGNGGVGGAGTGSNGVSGNILFFSPRKAMKNSSTFTAVADFILP